MEQNNDERLILAAKEGDVQTVKTLLDAGTNVNAKGYAGYTALMHATRNNHIDCVQILLNAGADVNLENALGKTALIMAEETKCLEVVKLLEEGYNFASGLGGAVDSKLVGIGGWLILPAIGLIVGPIISVIGIVKTFDLFSSMMGDGYGGYFMLSICIQIGLLIYILVAAKRFLGLKRSAPATMIGLRVASLMASALLFIVALG